MREDYYSTSAPVIINMREKIIIGRLKEINFCIHGWCDPVDTSNHSTTELSG